MQQFDKLMHLFRYTFLKRVGLLFALTATVMLIAFVLTSLEQRRTFRQDYTRLAYHATIDYIQTYITQHRRVNTDELFAHLKTQESLKDISYHLMLFAPDGQAVVFDHLYTATGELPRLPNFNQDTSRFDKQGLNAWKNLPKDYQIYVEFAYPTRYDVSVLYWFWLITLGTFILFLLLSRQWLWQWQLIDDYLQRISQSNTYHPLKGMQSFEFVKLAQNLNRLSYRLVQKDKQLNQTQRLIEHSLEQAPIALFEVDRRGRLYYANAYFLQSFKLSQQQLRQTLLTDIIHTDTKSVQKQLADLSTLSIGLDHVVSRSMERHYYRLLLKPIISDTEETAGVVGCLVDIHKHKITADKQQQQQLILEERLKENDRLWAVLGHELRTPLSGVIGMINLLKSTQLDEEQQDYMSVLDTSSQSMLVLLNDLLDLAKMDAGRMQATYEQVNLLSLCRDVCQLMLGKASQKQLELMFFADPDVPQYISTDAAKLRQVLLNLIGNAIKFTETGFVALTLESTSPTPTQLDTHGINSDAEDWLNIRITDSGVGISAADQTNLFNFFNQANAKINQNYGGTGLGLAISKSIVTLFGGFVELNSSLNEGAEFDIYIPLSSDHQQTPYDWQFDFSQLHVVVFIKHAVGFDYLNRYLNYLGANAIVSGSLSRRRLDEIENQLQSVVDTTKIVVLVDYLLVKDNQTTELFAEHTMLQRANKVLLSQNAERTLSNQLVEQIQGFLTKPIYLEQLAAELMRISSDDKRKWQPSYQDTISYKDVKPTYDTVDLIKHNRQMHIGVNKEVTASQSPQSDTTVSNKISDTVTASVYQSQYDLNILVAEDNPLNQQVIKKMLQKYGCQVTIAANGQIAVEALSQASDNNTYDLVFMDCRMPVMDGFEATTLIRQQHADLPIVALTANNSAEDKARCQAVGMTEFMTKPIKRQKLQQLLADISQSNTLADQ